MGDASGYIESLKRSQSATNTFIDDQKKLSTNVKASADAQVAASVKKTARLRSEVAAYREIAAAASKGSREQIAASNLAVQAESRLARSMGVTAGEARALSVSSGHVERDISRASRGALAGSGVFRGLGRSIAFASGGFLAFATAGQFLRSSIDAAKENQVTQRQLAAQFTASGKNVADFQKRIDDLATHLGLLAGFTNDEVKSAFTTIFRTTNNVGKSLRDTALAADLARAKNISLAQAALIVAKTEAGNTTLLRRQGIEIAKHATAQEALAKLQQVVAGQARAGTTAQERFGAVLHNTEEIVGTALLPTLNKYLTRGAAWLTQMNQSGKLQRDIATDAHDVSDAFQAAAAVVRTVDRVTGSFTNTLKGLAATWLVLKLRLGEVQWGMVGGEIAGAGASAAIAESKVARLAGGLRTLAAIGIVTVGIDLVQKGFSFKKLGEDLTSPLKGLPGPFGQVFDPRYSSYGHLKPQYDPNSGLYAGYGGYGGLPPGGKLVQPPGGSATKRLAGDPTGNAFKAAAQAYVRSHPASSSSTLQGRFNTLELQLANAQAANNVKLTRSILENEASILAKQRDSAKTLKARTAFAQQLASVMDQIRGIDSADASAAKKAQAARDKAASTYTTPIKLTLAEAKANALAGGSSTLTSAQQSAEQAIRAAAIRALKSGKLALQAQIDAWNVIAQVNQTLGGQAAGTAKAATSTKYLVSGLGLSRDQAVAIRERAAQVSAHGHYSTSTGGAGMNFFGPININGVRNIDELEAQLEKRRRRKPQRTGQR